MGHGGMPLKKINKTITFKGIEITFEKESYLCPVCGLGASSINQAGTTQRTIANSYRKAVGLLTGDEIRETRKKLGLTRKSLADKMTVSIANIKKWEGSIIQTKAEDIFLRQIFENKDNENKYADNHKISGSDNQVTAMNPLH